MPTTEYLQNINMSYDFEDKSSDNNQGDQRTYTNYKEDFQKKMTILPELTPMMGIAAKERFIRSFTGPK